MTSLSHLSRRALTYPGVAARDISGPRFEPATAATLHEQEARSLVTEK